MRVKALDCEIVVSEFELQSRYYVHFRAHIVWERYEPPYPPSYVLNSSATVHLEEWIRHSIIQEGWYASKQN